MRRSYLTVASITLSTVTLTAALAACSSRPPPAPSVTPTSAAARPTASAAARAGASARTPSLAPSPVELGGAPPQAATPAPIPPGGQVLLRQSGGSGGQTVNLQTAAFTSPGSWDLNWSYACGSSPSTGNLGINVYTAAGAYIFNPPSVSQVGPRGQGTQQYNIGGTFTLTINSVCPWTVTVVTAARPTATPTITAAAPASTQASDVSAIVAAVPTPSSAGTPAAAAAAGVGGGGGGGGVRAIGRAIPTPAPVVPAAVSNPLTGGSFSFGSAAAAATSAAGTSGSSTGGLAVATLTPIAAGTQSPSAPSGTSGRR